MRKGNLISVSSFGWLIILSCLLLPRNAGAAVSYTYDLNGNRSTMTDATGITHYEYDALNRVTSITNPNGEITSYTYDAVGQRTSATLPNGVVSSYSYDAAGRLLDLVHKLNTTNVGSFSYTYDKVGNRTSMTDEYGTHSYVYDQLNRLIQATHPQPTNPMEQFAYDAVGNRLDTSIYSAGNRLLEDADYYYDYDKNGNTTQKLSKTTGELTKLYYDAENQLTKLEKYHSLSDTVPYSTVSYIYDGLGRRVAKNVAGNVTKYVYDQEDILLETDVNDAIQARYTHGPGIDEPISMDKGGSSYYYVADALGSITKVLDATGNVVNNYVYDSFGNMVERTEGVANPYTYTGREYDAESGLYYYRNRYYDAKTGRFLSEDPLMSDPNAYTYVGNNPINFIDPWGLQGKNTNCDGFDLNKFWGCFKRCMDTMTFGFGRHLATTFSFITLDVLGGASIRTNAGEMSALAYFAGRYLYKYGLKLPAHIFAYIYQSIFSVSQKAITYSRYAWKVSLAWAAGTSVGCTISCSYDPDSY